MTRSLRAGALGLFLVVATACDTTTDPKLVVEVGITLLALIDSGLSVQTVDPALDENSAPIQVAQWEVESALLLLPDNAVDLSFGETCRFTDSLIVPPVAVGKCVDGIVLQATPTPIEVSLRLRIRPITLARAKPVPWDEGGSSTDYDGDGLDNEEDLCPLLPVAQTDIDPRDGIGDLCSGFDSATGLPAPDNDGDGVIDRRDNCVWISNPGQENTTGLGTEANIPDGIGDACEEQTARLAVDQAIDIVLGPLTFQQPFAAGTLLVADFRDAIGNCTWSSGGRGTCSLVSEPRFCSSSTSLILALGCP